MNSICIGEATFMQLLNLNVYFIKHSYLFFLTIRFPLILCLQRRTGHTVGSLYHCRSTLNCLTGPGAGCVVFRGDHNSFFRLLMIYKITAIRPARIAMPAPAIKSFCMKLSPSFSYLQIALTLYSLSPGSLSLWYVTVVS